jgi:hypothetical protein
VSRARTLAVAALAAVGLAVVAYLVLRPTDESRILAHVNGDLQDLFEPDVRMSLPEVTEATSGREALAELVAGAPRFVSTFDVDFASVTIKLDEARTTALVGATAKVKVLGRDGSASQERRAVDVRFVRKDGAWVIRTLTVWTKQDATPG